MKPSPARKDALHLIKAAQLQFAVEMGIELNGDYVKRPEENLFLPIHVETRRELNESDCEVFGNALKPGSISAVHSSTALAVNAFDYWRHKKDLAPWSAVFGEQLTEIAVERKYKFWRWTPANLDIILFGQKTIAIESKFTEPFQTHRGVKEPFSQAYFQHENESIWKALPRCRQFASEITEAGPCYEMLCAEQLIKHSLGLRADGRPYLLVYLWFDPSCLGDEAFAQANQHRAEIDDFVERVGTEIPLRTLTYQELFEELVIGSDDSQYRDYMSERYGLY